MEDKQIFEDYANVINFMETLDDQIVSFARMVKNGIGWVNPEYALESIFTIYTDENPSPIWDTLISGGVISWHGIKLSLDRNELEKYVVKKLEELGVEVKEEDPENEDY